MYEFNLEMSMIHSICSVGRNYQCYYMYMYMYEHHVICILMMMQREREWNGEEGGTLYVDNVTERTKLIMHFRRKKREREKKICGMYITYCLWNEKDLRNDISQSVVRSRNTWDLFIKVTNTKFTISCCPQILILQLSVFKFHEITL